MRARTEREAHDFASSLWVEAGLPELFAAQVFAYPSYSRLCLPVSKQCRRHPGKGIDGLQEVAGDARCW